VASFDSELEDASIERYYQLVETLPYVEKRFQGCGRGGRDEEDVNWEIVFELQI